MKVLGKYQITYANGFIQEKYLIDAEDYREVVKPIQSVVGYLEIHKSVSGSVGKLKSVVKEIYGSEFFTTESPMFHAIKSGVLDLPLTQGGKVKCKVKKIQK